METTTEAPAVTETEATTEETTSGGSTETVYYKVSFAVALEEYKDRVTLPNEKLYKAGTVIEFLPTPALKDMLFMGWYYDAAMTREVKLTDTVDADVTLYAKVVDTSEDIVAVDSVYYHTAFDVPADFIFSVKADSLDDVRAGLGIVCISSGSASLAEGEDYVITDKGDGIFEISAKYKAGKTYRATTSSDKTMRFIVDENELSEQVTTLNILTAKEQVTNLALADGLIYIPLSDVQSISSVASGLVSVSSVGTTVNSGDMGVFVYQGAKLKSGDRVAIYEGDIPTIRDFTTDNGSVRYLTVTAVRDNGAYEFRVSESTEVLFIPDVFPVAGKTNVENEAKIAISTLNFESDFFKQLGMNEDTVVEVGDYIAFFDGPMSSETPVEYVKITAVSRDDSYYYVDYVPVTLDEVIASMDIYQTRTETPTLTNEQTEAIKVRVQSDALNSGFVDDAADYLVSLYLSTNGLEKLPAVVSASNITSAATKGGLYYEITKCEAAPDIKVGEGVLKHFEESDGIRVELVLSFEIEFTVGEDGKNKVVISAEAVFEEEILLSVNVDGGAVWAMYGIIPYIADYEMNANLDIGTYTGFSAVTKVYTNNGEEKEEEDDDDDSFFPDFDFDKIGEGDGYEEKAKNIGEELKKLFELNEKLQEEIKGEDEDDTGNDITEKYAEMMESANESWIDIVREEIYKQTVNLDSFGILNFEIGIDFVVSAQLYVMAGMEVETGVAKRYNFSVALFSRSVTTDVIDLEKEHFAFKFYCMGTAGLKIGFELEMALVLISSDAASVGVSAELGVSLGIWGYFYYSYEKEGLDEPEIQKAGAMFFEIGIYLEVKFKAQLFNIDKLTYNPTLYENNWPIYSVGSQENVFAFEDYSNSQLTIRMQGTQTVVLPSYIFRMKYLDLKDGKYYAGKDPGDETPSKTFDDDSESRFIIEISDNRFTYDPKTNKLTTTMDVSAMEIGDQYEVTITLTYKHGALAFNQEVITRDVTVLVTNDKDHRYIELYSSHKSLSSSTLPCKIGEPVALSALPDYGVVDGYRHIGWKWESYHEGHSYGDPFTGINAMPEGKNLTLVAVWEPVEIEFSVRLFLERPDGIYVLDRTITATSLCGEYFSYASIVPDGYERVAGNLGVEVEYGGVYDLYLVREIKKIYFGNVDEAGNSIVVQLKAGTALVPPVVSKSGYTFAGWALYNSNEVIDLPETVPYDSDYNVTHYGADFRYTAVWAPVTNVPYTIKHYIQNPNDSGYTCYMTEYATGSNKEQISAHDCVSQAVLDDGYIYARGEHATVELDGSSVVRLYYTREAYALRLDPNGGSMVGIINRYPHGQTIDLSTLEIPRREGYRFVGWDGNQDGVADETMIMPKEDTRIYAVWAGAEGTEYRIIHMLKNANDDNYTQVGISYAYGVTDTTPDVASIYDAKYMAEGMIVANYDKARVETIYVPYRDYLNKQDMIATMYAYYDRVSYNVNIKAYDPETQTLVNELIVSLPYGRTLSESYLPDLAQFNVAGYSASRYSNSGYTEMPDHDIEMTVQYAKDGQTPFLVYHYVQDTSGNYVLRTYTSQKGNVGENLSKSFRNYVLASLDNEQYIYADYCSEGVYLERDGSTVLNIYYSRTTATVSGFIYKLDANGNRVEEISFSEEYYLGAFFSGEGRVPYYNFDHMYVGTTNITTARGFTVTSSFGYDHVQIYLTPQRGVRYTVNEYTEKVDGTGYELTRTDYYVGSQDQVISADSYTRYLNGRTVNTDMLADIVLDAATENALNIYYDRNVYEVKFINEHVEGGNTTYNVKFGAPIPAAPTNTELEGYSFVAWRGYADYVGKEMGSTTLRFYAEYQAASNTAFRVDHYVMALDGTYSQVKSEAYTGTTNAKITSDDYLLADYYGNGFTVKARTTLSIAPDGSTVMSIYYDRVTASYSYHYYLNGEMVNQTSMLLTYGADVPEAVFDCSALYPEYGIGGYSIYVDGQYVAVEALSTTMGKDALDVRVELEAIGPEVTIIHKVMNPDGETYTDTEETFIAVPFEKLDLTQHLLTTLGHGFTYRTPVNNDIPSATVKNVYEIYYDRNTYTLIYSTGYNFDQVTEEYLFGATIGDAPSFTRPGYVQAGWTSDIPETMPANDVTITAQWQLKDSVAVTIVYMMAALDGEGYVEATRETVYATPELMLYGDTYAKGIAGGTYQRAENKVVAEDGTTEICVYYARNTYTIRFTYGEIAGAGEDVVLSLAYGAALTAPEFAVTGYNLVGWTPELPATVPAENLTYVAIWQASAANVTINHYVENVDGQGNELFATETVSVATGSTVNGSAYQKTPTGFTYASADRNVVVLADGSTVVNVYYTRNTYKVTFTYGEMSGDVVEYTVKYGANLPEAPALTVQGYVFAGWDAEILATMPASDLTYAATWAADENTPFVVEHYYQNANDNGYTLAETVTEQGTTNTEVNGANLRRDLANAVFERAETKTINADGSTVIKVYYTRTTHKITFTYGDKVGESEEYTLRYGQTVSCNPSFSVQGYVFAGWDAQIPATMPAEDITLNATWTAGQGVAYKVEHYVQNANDDDYTLTQTDNRTGTTGATVNGADLATLVGNGLKLSSAESKAVEADGSTVIKIYYDRESYTVTYTYGSMAGENTVQTVRFGADLPEAPEFAVVGYTFAGWDADPADTMPASDLVYAAQWTANENTMFTVEHYYQNADDDEYTLIDSQTAYGTTASAVNGADYKQDFDQAIYERADRQTIAADGSTIVKVYYVRSQYRLTYLYDFGSDEQEGTTLRYGQTLPAAPVFEKVGYTFGAWIDEEGLWVEELVATMPAHDVTYTAYWMGNEDTPFRVEHYVEQADGDGYDLVGSSDEAGRTGEWVDLYTYAYEDTDTYRFERVGNEDCTLLPDGSAVFKIYYQRIRYVVTFWVVDQNNTPIEGVDAVTLEFKCGQTIEPPAFEGVEGYTFFGYDTIYETMPAEAIEYFIVWTCLHASTDGDDVCDRCGDPLECIDQNEDGHCDYCHTPNDPEDHRYLDENTDHICDICYGSFTDLCYDNDGNAKCDVCDTPTICPVTDEEHMDGDDDHICDDCGVWISYVCYPAEDVHYCLVCYKRFYELCTDEDEDCWCDECGDSIPCVDEDGDDVCDVCGNEMPCPGHVDEDQNAICDLCKVTLDWCHEFNDMHRDDNYDHTCDHCGLWLSWYCFDWNEDGRCEDCYRPTYCTENYDPHVDGDGDHYCDACGEWMSYLCADADGDWTCDDCGNTLVCIDHIDEDGNALCDICREETKCKQNPYDIYHEDYDYDHTCDWCGVRLSMYCYDEDYDGHCDECGQAFACDHYDEDGDNYCDRCYRVINCTHEYVTEHYCDECYQKVSDCYDEDGDLCCDECWGYVECRHNGMEGEHICYFCYDFLTDCVDEDGDGMCDLASEYFPH